MTLRPALFAAAVLTTACLLPAGLQAADSTRCANVVEKHLRELPLAAGEVKSVRIIERVNIANDFGPEIFGVDAWVRLNSCAGWLIIEMTESCYARQSFTRGDCDIEGVSSY